MNPEPEQGEPLTTEEIHALLDAIKSSRLLIGGYAKAGEALKNTETLTDKQLDFWMIRSSLSGRLEFFDALGDRRPTKKMLKWISKPELMEEMVRFHVIFGKESVVSYIKAIFAYGSDEAVDPRLVDLAREYELEHLIDTNIEPALVE